MVAATMTSAAAIQHQSMTSPIEIFRERCEARAILIANGYLDFHIAIDELQESAVSQGLVKRYGQDAVQQILSEAFGRWSV